MRLARALSSIDLSKNNANAPAAKRHLFSKKGGLAAFGNAPAHSFSTSFALEEAIASSD